MSRVLSVRRILTQSPTHHGRYRPGRPTPGTCSAPDSSPDAFGVPELNPGLLGLMSDLRAGCGVRRGQAVKGDAPSGFDPCAPAGFDKFPPSKEL